MDSGAKTMESPTNYGCKYCGRSNFMTQYALNAHIERSYCGTLRNQAIPSRNPDNHERPNFDYNPPSPPRKVRAIRREIQGIEEHDVDAISHQISSMFTENGANEDSSDDNDNNFGYMDQETICEEQNLLKDQRLLENSPETLSNKSDSQSSGTNSSTVRPNTTIRDQLQAYCAKAKKEFMSFTEHEV